MEPKVNESNKPNTPSKKDNPVSQLKFTKQEIDEMLQAWEKEPELYLPERAINLLFSGEMQGVSNSIEKEFLKVAIINQVYGTSLYIKDILEMAEFLSKNSDELNKKLNAGSCSAVNMITDAIKKTQGKFCYSFATKYCSFSAPESTADEFPIYDSYMGALYETRQDKWNPDGVEGFENYAFDPWEGKPEENLGKYQKYKEAVHMLQKQLEPERKMTVKELDQYLWKAMKTKSKELVNGSK